MSRRVRPIRHTASATVKAFQCCPLTDGIRRADMADWGRWRSNARSNDWNCRGRRRQHRLLCRRLPGVVRPRGHAACPAAHRRRRPGGPARHRRSRRQRAQAWAFGTPGDRRSGGGLRRRRSGAGDREERRHRRNGEARREPCAGRMRRSSACRTAPAMRRCSGSHCSASAARRRRHGAVQRRPGRTAGWARGLSAHDQWRGPRRSRSARSGRSPECRGFSGRVRLPT